ncbi:hypothetical protein Taro_017530 [Colocasia esculenta]|uniref:Uncharacterized protein n=1 Tax=Colocasia esculenta TaxID=4460 RepID=A0A843UTH3_COLES|nr:hypothetical protein [Colocasia esculenta]
MAAALDAEPQELLLAPPQQPTFNRVTSCDRHPDQQVTGFCASCLRERLAGLDTANRRLNSASSSSGASAALKSLFFRPTSHNHNHGNADAGAPSSSSRSSFLPELRRCKSFSGGRGAPSASAMEPQRKSCDVRVRNTLWSLFHLDDGGPAGGVGGPSNLLPPVVFPAAVNASAGGEIEVEARSLRFDTSVADPVIESPEGVEEEDEEEGLESGEVEIEAVAATASEELGQCDDEIKMARVELLEETKHEEMRGEEQLRTMKDHIDLNAQCKKPPPKDLKEIAGSFWLAASVFSKKLQKWRRKQKLKKQDAAASAACGGKATAAAIRAEKPSSRSRRFFRDAQSELAEEAFGRRSCDTDPRFSLDAGRMSFDDPRFSWDEPRASWDGYLTGGRSVFPRLPPMLSVIEDAPAAPSVQRLDGQIPVEEDSTIPGGSAQTKDYYLDSSQRRRRSLDRSSSVRRPSFEADELPRTSNAKASPTAMASEYFNFVNKFERECRDSNTSSLRDDYSESFDSAFRDPLKVGGGVGGNPKKSRRWSKAWSLWGLIHRRNRSRGVGANGVERSFSETWPELQHDSYNGKFSRCNSSVSSRHCSNGNGNTGLGGIKRNGLEINGHGKKRAGEFVLERNRSARYSPSHFDNGLLRFYLTPMRSSRRSGGGSGKGRHLHSHSFTRSMLQLY